MAASRARTVEPPTAARRKPPTNSAASPSIPTRRPESVTPAPIAAPVAAAATDDQIAERAYYIWLRKGRPMGQDHENWMEATAELNAERAKG